MSWLDDVRLRERIGKGSFGRVYRADLQRPWGTDACAIKIVETESRAELCAALREVAFLRLAGAHPNIVTFIGLSAHAADRGGCSLHVFLELCVCSLADVVRSRKAPLSDLAVLACAHEIASALRFLHDELAAVHRDVKGANILLSASGALKLTDFNVSAMLGAGRPPCATTIGTPHYMAPEVILGEGYSFAADLWSLGITMLELADGHAPHAGLEPMAAMFRVAMSPAPALESGCMRAAHVGALVARLAVKAPAERLTAEALLRDGCLAPVRSVESRASALCQLAWQQLAPSAHARAAPTGSAAASSAASARRVAGVAKRLLGMREEPTTSGAPVGKRLRTSSVTPASMLRGWREGEAAAFEPPAGRSAGECAPPAAWPRPLPLTRPDEAPGPTRRHAWTDATYQLSTYDPSMDGSTAAICPLLAHAALADAEGAVGDCGGGSRSSGDTLRVDDPLNFARDDGPIAGAWMPCCTRIEMAAADAAKPGAASTRRSCAPSPPASEALASTFGSPLETAPSRLPRDDKAVASPVARRSGNCYSECRQILRQSTTPNVHERAVAPSRRERRRSDIDEIVAHPLVQRHVLALGAELRALASTQPSVGGLTTASASLPPRWRPPPLPIVPPADHQAVLQFCAAHHETLLLVCAADKLRPAPIAGAELPAARARARVLAVTSRRLLLFSPSSSEWRLGPGRRPWRPKQAHWLSLAALASDHASDGTARLCLAFARGAALAPAPAACFAADAVCGAEAEEAAGCWRVALRVAPALGEALVRAIALAVGRLRRDFAHDAAAAALAGRPPRWRLDAAHAEIAARVTEQAVGEEVPRARRLRAFLALGAWYGAHADAHAAPAPRASALFVEPSESDDDAARDDRAGSGAAPPGRARAVTHVRLAEVLHGSRHGSSAPAPCTALSRARSEPSGPCDAARDSRSRHAARVASLHASARALLTVLATCEWIEAIEIDLPLDALALDALACALRAGRLPRLRAVRLAGASTASLRALARAAGPARALEVGAGSWSPATPPADLASPARVWRTRLGSALDRLGPLARGEPRLSRPRTTAPRALDHSRDATLGFAAPAVRVAVSQLDAQGRAIGGLASALERSVALAESTTDACDFVDASPLSPREAGDGRAEARGRESRPLGAARAESALPVAPEGAAAPVTPRAHLVQLLLEMAY